MPTVSYTTPWDTIAEFASADFRGPRERAILVRDFKAHQNEHVKKFALFQGSEKQCTF